MKFKLSEEKAMSARQAIHDAFLNDQRAIDYEALANGSGVQFTTKGADNCIMDHCDKGKVQQVLFKLQKRNLVAWAWAMLAYAPQDAISLKTAQCILIPYLFVNLRNKAFNPFQIDFYRKLCERAITDACADARAGRRQKHDRKAIAAICRCSKEDYETSWRFQYYRIKDMLVDLDSVALPPVGNLIWACIDKENGSITASEDLQKILYQCEPKNIASASPK